MAATPRLLVMDYSTDRKARENVAQWLPHGLSADIYSLADDTESGRFVPPDPKRYTHIVHTGSSFRIWHDQTFMPVLEQFVRSAVDLECCQLGICYGHQLLCRAVVGKHAVRANPAGAEVGWARISLTGEGMDAAGADRPEIQVFQFHYDEVTVLPSGSTRIAFGGKSEIQGFVCPGLRLTGFQFHPEKSKETGDFDFSRHAEAVAAAGYSVDAVLRGVPTGFDPYLLFARFLGVEESIAGRKAIAG